MIRLLKKICSLLSLVTVITANANAQEVALITGNFNKPLNGSVTLFEIKQGVLKYIAIQELDELHSGFALTARANKAALYYLVLNNKTQNRHKQATRKIAQVPVYMKPGELIDIHFLLNSGFEVTDYSISNPSNENTALHKWTKQSESITSAWKLQTQESFKSYYNRYHQLLPALTALSTDLKCPGNPGFTNTLHALSSAELKFSPVLAYNSNREWQNDKDSSLVKKMLEVSYKRLLQFCNAEILNAGMGSEMVSLYDAWYNLKSNPSTPNSTTESRISQIKNLANIICNDTLKGFYITAKLSGIYKISSGDFDSLMSGLKENLVLDYMQDAYRQKISELTGIKNGTAFSNENFTGNAPTKNIKLKKGSNLAYIHGVLGNFNINGDISLLRVSNGAASELYRYRLNSDERDFIIPTQADKPTLYYIQCSGLTFRVYLEPAGQLTIKILKQPDSTSGRNYYTYEVTNGSEENKVLQNWFNISLPVTVHGNTNRIVGIDTTSLLTFSSAYQAVHAQIPAFEKSLNNYNESFRQLVQEAIEVDMEYSSLLFLAYKTDRTRYLLPKTFPGFKTVPSFYNRFINAKKFCTNSVLLFREGADYINLYSKLNVALYEQQTGQKAEDNQLIKYMLHGICSDSIRSFIISQQLDEIAITNLSQFNTFFLPVKEYLVNENVKNKYNAIFADFARDTAFLGKPVFDISLPDSSGKIINVNSFKGKVIFIDTWATWCGPCKEQLPFLKTLEETYKNEKDILFIGISIDRAKDINKWKKMIVREQLPGIQLIDESGKQFSQPMMIESIPRFLLIDKNGNWVEVRCPNPDEKEKLKKYIDKALHEAL